MVTLYEVSWPEPLPLSGTRFWATYDWTGAVIGQTVQAPPAGSRIALWQITGSVSVACDITLFFNTDTQGNRVKLWNANGRGPLVPVYFPGWRIAAADDVLRITTAAWNLSTPAGTVTVDGFYFP